VLGVVSFLGGEGVGFGCKWGHGLIHDETTTTATTHSTTTTHPPSPQVTAAEGFGKARLFEMMDDLEGKTRALMEDARKKLAGGSGVCRLLLLFHALGGASRFWGLGLGLGLGWIGSCIRVSCYV